MYMSLTEVFTIFVQWRLANNTSAIVEKLLAKFLRSCVRLTLRRVTSIDHKLHEFDEIGVSAVHNGDTAGSDLTVDGSETAEQNIIEHEESILTNPVPRRVEVTSLQRVKYGLDTVNIGVTVLTRNIVESSLKQRRASLFFVVENLALAGVTLQVARVEVDLLVRELMLLSLELEEFFAVHHSTCRRASCATARTAGRKSNAHTLSVELCSGVEPGFALGLRAQALGRLHGGSN
jgi:phosphoribosylformylglycinamidine (FGAM) synthase PurS component